VIPSASNAPISGYNPFGSGTHYVAPGAAQATPAELAQNPAAQDYYNRLAGVSFFTPSTSGSLGIPSLPGTTNPATDNPAIISGLADPSAVVPTYQSDYLFGDTLTGLQPLV
jgi:hypothetical protein